jgi:hypothetical protein
MRILARVLLGLGAFLLIAGVLAVAYAPGAVKKTPLDVDTTTVYEGEAAKIDAATGDFDKKPVYAIRHTLADSEKSGDDHVLFVETACAVFDTGGAQECVNGNDPDLITASIDIFATDRETAMSVADKNLPDDAIPTEGLVNKFPFDVEKKSYPFWDGDIARAVDIKYDGTEELFGLKTYRFTYTVTDEPIDVAEGIPGTYSNTVTVNVDPKTGSIVRSGQDQQRFLEDGTPVLDIQVIGTDATVKEAVDDAKAAGKSLTVLLTIVPLVGFIGGILCLLLGAILLLRGGERGQRVAPRHDGDKVGAGV